MTKTGSGSQILQDIAIIALSVLIAILLVRTDALAHLLSSGGTSMWGALIAGMFFTSIFTTAPAMAALGEIALIQGIWMTAFLGALGAVLGDLLIFRFVRGRLSDHVSEVVMHQSVWKRFRLLFRRRLFRWLTVFVGGVILASPLPDELGVAVLGLSHMQVKYFIVLSFVFNFIGIFAIGLVARSLAG